jgi:hypothetical protein
MESMKAAQSLYCFDDPRRSFDHFLFARFVRQAYTNRASNHFGAQTHGL